MGIGKLLSREKTLPSVKSTTTFYASSTYVPVYGKTTFKITGRGTPGNAPVPGNISGTNPNSGANTSYNPSTGGNYAGVNPSTPGNYAGINPSTPGNYAGLNPATGGTLDYNPVVPGNYLNANPAIYTYEIYDSGMTQYTNYSFPPNANSSVNYVNSQPVYGRPGTTTYTIFVYSAPAQARIVQQSNGVVYNVPDVEYSSYNVNGDNRYYFSHTFSLKSYTPAGANYNPATGGNSFYNPVSPGNPYYNATTPGNPYYNPSTPGNVFYNPIEPGTEFTNPLVPGNSNYNPGVSGNPGANATVLGVTFPGGLPGAPGALVPPTTVSLSYTAGGVSINVPPGGYVDITNS